MEPLGTQTNRFSISTADNQQSASSPTNRFSIPDTSKMDKIKKEQQQYDKKAKQANSFLGKALNFYKAIPGATEDVLKGIAQGIARSVGSVGVTAGNIPTQIRNKALGKNEPLPFAPEIQTSNNPISNAVFGGQPIRTLQGAVQNTQSKLEPYLGQKESKFLAPPLVIGSVLLDLSGFGGKAGLKSFTNDIPEQFFKYVAKEKSPQVIEDTLKSIGLDELNSKILAPKLAETNTVDEAKNVLINHDLDPKPSEMTRAELDKLYPEFKSKFPTLSEEDYKPKKEPINLLITEGFDKGGVLIPKDSTFTDLTKQVSQADRLISEGKIRVVSRDGRDVYQIKKGNDWVNTRDEDSAVKQITEPYIPKPKQYSPVDQKKIDEANFRLNNLRENLSQHPAKPLLKFINKKEGEFLNFKNPNLANSAEEKQKIIDYNRKVQKVAESAFEGTKYSDEFSNEDVIKEVIDDYKVARQIEKGLVQEKNNLIKQAKPIQNIKPNLEKYRQEISPIDVSEGEGRSIEIQANQARDILSGEPVGVDVSLPKIIQNTMTNVNKKVHIIDTYLTTPHFVMEKIGFGKEAKMLRDGADAYWKELPKNLDVITKWSKEVSQEGNKNIFRYLDGEAITLKPEEKKVALEIKNWLQDWAKRLKLPEDNQISHYITHIFDKELIKKEFDEDLAKIIADKIPGQVYDPFLLKRLGTKGYKQDTWTALDAYVKRATRKVYMDPVLEAIQSKAGSSLEFSNIEKSQFNYIKKYIDNINMRPNDTEEGVDNFIKSIIGYTLGQRPTTSILKFLRQATFRGMLGLNPASALRNLSQGINTYAVLGEKYTALGYLKLFSNGAGEELTREGVLNAGFVQDRALNATKKALEKIDKVLFTFFDRAEKINRGAAYFGAKSKALDMGKSEQEAIDYAKSIVRKTQFVFDSVDTPVGLSSDTAKTLLQFQTYTTKQIEFLTHLAKDKNFAGLLRYAVAGMAFVYSVGKMFGMQPKDLLPWYRFQTPPSLKLPVETGKAILNLPDKYGRSVSIDQKLKNIGNASIGLIPAGNQIKKTVQGINMINQGGSYTKNNKLKYKQGESTESKIQSALFGKNASLEAQNYYNSFNKPSKKAQKSRSNKGTKTKTNRFNIQ